MTLHKFETLPVGTPLMMRLGRVAHVCGSKPSAGVMLGSGRRVSADLQIVTEAGDLQEIPDALAIEWAESAARYGLPTLSAEDAAAKLAEAQAKRFDAQRKAIEEREAASIARKAFLAEAERRMPAGSKAVLVAELVEDQSDSMTDYFGHTTKRVVILAWSPHTRDIFSEMRKAAAKFGPTAHLATAPESAEHREKWSMGGGYYLKDGFRHSSGWKVCKRTLYGGGVGGLPDRAEWMPEPEKPAEPEAAAAIAAPSGIQIEEHVHTKRGFKMWIVILADRVERDEFDRLRTAAEALGGWYSRPWGKTPGGFAFKSQEAAEAFAGTGSPNPDPEPDPGKSKPEAAPSAKAPASVEIGERLRSIADRMESDITHKLGDRLANTPKRRREADSARIEGRRLQRTQQALRALAEAHEAGTVPAILSGIRTKAAAYDLLGSEIDRSRAGYYDAGVDLNRPAKQSPEALALWDLIAGKSAFDAEAEKLRQMVADLRFANIPGFFPTPAGIVSQMIDAARLPKIGWVRILEPEAGSGAILDGLRKAAPEAELVAYERNFTLAEILKRKGYTLAGSDFLEAKPGVKFERVLMNPPFENGQDMEHVRHAFDFLYDGGTLVAIMSPGPFFRSDRKAVAFREWFEALGGERWDLPAGAFKESGTGAASVMVRLDK